MSSRAGLNRKSPARFFLALQTLQSRTPSVLVGALGAAIGNRTMKKKLIEITPAKYRCEFDGSCPALFKSNQGTYVIIGKKVDLQSHSGLHGRIGDDETAVEISFEIVEDAINGAVPAKRSRSKV